MLGQIKVLVRIPFWRLWKSCLEDAEHTVVTLRCCPQHHGEDEPCNAVLINEVPCRAQLLCCQHLRDGNLLMLLATRMSIRAPFMWSPRFTWIWNAAKKPHLLQPLESNFLQPALGIHSSCCSMPTAPSWNWAELDYRKDQRLQHGSSPVFLAFSPPIAALASLVVEREAKTGCRNGYPDGHPWVN